MCGVHKEKAEDLSNKSDYILHFGQKLITDYQVTLEL
jgi:hypothetical protein